AADVYAVYVATTCGVSVSTDRGATWRHVLVDPAVPLDGARLQDRVFSVLALGGGVVLAATPGGVFRSRDRGETWSRSTGGAVGEPGGAHAVAHSPWSTSHVFLAGSGR